MFNVLEMFFKVRYQVYFQVSYQLFACRWHSKRNAVMKSDAFINMLWLAFMFSSLGLTFHFNHIFLMQPRLVLSHIYISYQHTLWNALKEYMYSVRVYEAQRDVTHLGTGDTTPVVLFNNFKSKENTLRPVGKFMNSFFSFLFFSDGQNNFWRWFVWNS